MDCRSPTNSHQGIQAARQEDEQAQLWTIDRWPREPHSLSHSDLSRLAPWVTASGKLSTVSVTHSGCQNVTLTKSFRMGKDVCGLLLSHFQQQKLTELWLKHAPRSRGNIDATTQGWPRAETPATHGAYGVANQPRMAARRALLSGSEYWRPSWCLDMKYRTYSNSCT